jgi:protein transport protein SEC61 subunit beta
MPKSAKRKKKKKTRRSSSRDSGPMPSGGAGLIRFFEDETPGIKVGPTLVVVMAAILVIITVVSHIGQQLQLWG